MSPDSHQGMIVRVGKGVGFIEGTGGQLGFTFDKLHGYKGQSAREIGLVEGCIVRFTIDNGVISQVSLMPKKGRA